MITATVGDIINQNVDSIVNPANGLGVMGAGVAVALRKAGGFGVQARARAQCNHLGIPVRAGKCYSTDAGHLITKGVKRIYHAVTMALPGSATDIPTVQKAMKAVLTLAIEDGMESIAIPGLGTGIGRLPVKEVASAMFHLALEFDKSIDIAFVDRNVDFIAYMNENLEKRSM